MLFDFCNHFRSISIIQESFFDLFRTCLSEGVSESALPPLVLEKTKKPLRGRRSFARNGSFETRLISGLDYLLVVDLEGLGQFLELRVGDGLVDVVLG